ncbi:MAG: carboxypeptidase-like regulatory domain-containing protein, partial [Bacteroidales bacterium]
MIRRITLSALFVLIMFLTGINVQAQRAGGIITGTIISGETQEPIAFANISLFDSENKLIKGTLSDKNGKFSIRELSFNEYQLEISCLGYAKLKKEIQIDEKAAHLKLGEIPLNHAAEQLGEVEVSAERMKGEQEV